MVLYNEAETVPLLITAQGDTVMLRTRLIQLGNRFSNIVYGTTPGTWGHLAHKCAVDFGIDASNIIVNAKFLNELPPRTSVSIILPGLEHRISTG